MPFQPNWLDKIAGDNLLAIYDVMLDIQEEANIKSDPILIPMMPQIIRFQELFPGDSIGMRDRYMGMRWKSLAFLEKSGIISELEWVDAGYHRWESRARVVVSDTTLAKALSMVEGKYHAILQRSKTEARPTAPPSSIQAKLFDAIFDRFHRVALALRNRRENRETLLIDDEYDVQDLLGALLSLYFDDVRREEWGPSYAGKSTRVDFLVKDTGILVEAKKPRVGLTDKQIGEQLIVDIAHYRQRPECKGLICFVYDPDHLLQNPAGLERDLSEDVNNFPVRVIVNPKA